MICPQKPALKLPQGVRSCELLDTDLSTEVAASLFSSAPAGIRGLTNGKPLSQAKRRLT